MKRITLAFAAALLSTQAVAQTQFPAGTLWGNVTASTGLPSTVAVPNCPSGALNYTAGTGFGCGGGGGGTNLLPLNNIWTGSNTFTHTPDAITVNSGVLYAGPGAFSAIGTNPYSLILNWQNNAGNLLYFQQGILGTPWAPTTNANMFGGQILADTTASGHTIAGITMDAQVQAGTGGGLLGLQILAQIGTPGSPGTWTPGGGVLPGVTGIEVVGKSVRGGHVWGIDTSGWCATVACTETYGIEVNVQNDIAGTSQASGIWLVNNNTVTPNAGSAILVGGKNNNVGFPTAGIYFTTVGGFSPLTTGATILKTDAITVAHGIDLSAAICSTDCWKSPGVTISGSGEIAWTGTGFTGYSPTITSTIGTITSTPIAVYKQYGKLVMVRITIAAITATGTAGGRMLISLPVSPSATANYALNCNGTNQTTHKGVTGQIFDSLTAVSVNLYDGTFPVVTGDGLNLVIVYEAS